MEKPKITTLCLTLDTLSFLCQINAETISNNVKSCPLYWGEQLPSRHCVKAQVEVWAVHHQVQECFF